jgi:hypothetical protein
MRFVQLRLETRDFSVGRQKLREFVNFGTRFVGAPVPDPKLRPQFFKKHPAVGIFRRRTDQLTDIAKPLNLLVRNFFP